MSKKTPVYKTKVTNHSGALTKLVLRKKTRKAYEAEQKKSSGEEVYLIRFDTRDKEDAFRKLEHDIDAVLLNAEGKAEVYLSIYSPGGSVTAYANAAAQVQRLRDNGITVTAFVDEIAASGGYMMACVAHRVVANPMAFVGSIGVVAGMPIIEDALKKVGVEFELFTAGKMKRTVIPQKKPNDEDRANFKAKMVDIHDAFRGHVQTWRKHVTEEIMDGDYFMAKDHVGTLVDNLGDSHSYMMRAFAQHRPIYRVTTEAKQGFTLKRFFGADTLIDTLVDRFIAKVFETRFTSIG